MEDNVLMMRCTKCGEMNRLPVVHCKKCGARLDFEAAEEKMKTVGEPTPQERARRAAKAGIGVALLLAILLIVWPGKMARTTGDEMDAKRYRMKGELLLDALNRGMPGQQTIEEKDINAHLRELVAAQPPRRGMAGRLEDAGARFIPGQAEIFVAVGRGPLTLTANFRARADGNRLAVTGAKVGHLPLPGILGRLYASTQGGLFRQMKNESRILRNLDGVVVNAGSIDLLTKAGQ